MHRFVAIIQNDPEVPAGVFEEALSEWQVPFRLYRPDLGGNLPEAPAAMIVLGGIMGVHDERKHPFLEEVKNAMRQALDNATPQFGICLGGQLLADVAGGVVTANGYGEKGLAEVNLTAAGVTDPLFNGVTSSFHAFQWHNDSFTTPPGSVHLAGSSICPGQAFRIGNAWGVQFHPEVDLSIVTAWSRKTPHQQRFTKEFALAEPEHRHLGRRLLGNFLTAAGFSR